MKLIDYKYYNQTKLLNLINDMREYRPPIKFYLLLKFHRYRLQN